MKKKLLSLVLLVSPIALFAQSQISNNGFESWASKVPTKWVNEYQTHDSTILKAQGAIGSNAMNVRVHFIKALNSNDYGYVTNRGKYTKSGVPQKLTFYSKANVMQADSVFIFLKMFKSGVPVGGAIYRKGRNTAASNFAFEQVPIIYVTGTTTVDSFEIAIQAGDANNNASQKNGTYIILDEFDFDGANTLSTGTNEQKPMQANLQPSISTGVTTLNYTLKEAGNLYIKTYNTLGTLVKEENFSSQVAGNYKVSLQNSELAEGAYFIVLSTKNSQKTLRFIIQH